MPGRDNGQYWYLARYFPRHRTVTAMASSSAATMENHTPSIPQKMGRISTDAT